MSVSDSFLPILVFLPSGTGNSSPFLRLAATMASRNCRVTFISIRSQAHPAFEFTTFFANHPQINLLNLEIINSNTPSHSTVTDPFIVHIQTINRSLDKLNPFLSSSQVSAIFSDFVLAAALAQISDNLHIPFYIISTTSARFFSLVSYVPTILSNDPNVFSNSYGEIEILGLKPIPKSSIPLAWKHEYSTNHLLTAYLLPNAKSLPKVNGVLLNTFHSFEPETIAALNKGIFLKNLPPVFPIGPLQFYGTHKILDDDDHHHHLLPWLSEQRAESVVYVNFGSREVMSADQMRELGKGLEICGYNYLWVMKGNNEVDEFSDRGVIIRGEVDQEQILANPAIGGFVNQCECDSVMQAAWNGVPILAWPQHGDQEMNAETVENAGLGVWIKEWAPVEKMIEGEEIGQRVAEVMGYLNVKKRAKIVREKAREACEIGGSSEKAFKEVVEILTSKTNLELDVQESISKST